MIERNDRMLGESHRFLEVQERVSQIAPLNKPVLIVGERGTGKELVAARVHYLSERWGQPYIKVNCAAISESLMESELFGHEAGAFSGAMRQHKGYFERADGGTLFLLKEQMRQLDKNLRGFEQAALQLRSVANVDELRADLVSAICDRAFIGDDDLPRGLKAFEDQVKRARTRLPAVNEAACRMFTTIAMEHHQLSLVLGAAKGTVVRAANDVRAQLQRLVYRGFFNATPWPQLSHLPRYLQAMRMRLAKFPANAERDAKHAASIAQLWGRYEMRLDQQQKAGMVDPRLPEFRWQIEELRVSLYAQELKTPYPVSYKRLDKLWAAMG